MMVDPSTRALASIDDVADHVRVSALRLELGALLRRVALAEAEAAEWSGEAEREQLRQQLVQQFGQQDATMRAEMHAAHVAGHHHPGVAALDPTALAAMVADAVSALLDQRLAVVAAGAAPTPAVGIVEDSTQPAPPAATPLAPSPPAATFVGTAGRSVTQSLRQPDVVLTVVAIAVVALVLLAWLV